MRPVTNIHIPSVLALDVNETLSDISALSSRLDHVGAPRELLGTWFASTLRDGFALTAAGTYADFSTVAGAALRALLEDVQSLNCQPDEAIRQVLAGMAELPLHEDVRPGLRQLQSVGIRLVTLTNGSAATAWRLLERGGVAQYVEQCLSIEEVRRWKPAPEPYRYAARCCGVPPKQVLVAAVHPWDIHGAKQAGLRAAWIHRRGHVSPSPFVQPNLICPDLPALAESLAHSVKPPAA